MESCQQAEEDQRKTAQTLEATLAAKDREHLQQQAHQVRMERKTARKPVTEERDKEVKTYRARYDHDPCTQDVRVLSSSTDHVQQLGPVTSM